MITSKDNLQASLGPITYKDNIQVCLHISNLRASPGFYAQTTCLTAKLEHPLSRDLNLDHILELHCSSLHHTKMQVRSSKSNSSFQKKHITSQIASGNIFCLSCTQRHARLHPAKPGDHTWSHTEVAPRSALPINGTTFPIWIYINLQVNLLIHFILEPIINCTLQVPQNMLCNNQSGTGSICSQKSKYLVSYSSGTSRNKSYDDTSWHQLSLMKHYSIASGSMP